MFSRFSVHRKMMLILGVMMVPVIGLIVLYLFTMQQFAKTEHDVDHLLEVQVHTQEIMTLVVDVQRGFRGFVLTRNEKFLDPLYAAEERLDPAIHQLKQMVQNDPAQLQKATEIEIGARALLKKKRQLIDAVRVGQTKPVREYIESGAGEALLSQIRTDIRAFEDLLKKILDDQQDRAAQWAALTQHGLATVVVGTLLLWWLGSRLLARNITRPIATLTDAAHEFGRGKFSQPIPIHSTDELGRLARTMEEMQGRIERHLLQMTALHEIGNDISMIGPDGLEGVLKRIAERAGSVLNADLCLVLLWNKKIGCWNVGAASGVWHERLRGSVMIREETPISFQAFADGAPQMVEDLAARPETVIHIRDRFGAKSLLAVPLRGPEEPFGVLAVAPTREKRAFTDLDVRLTQQFADLAAIAILNARLYETVQQRGEGLQIRLQELERYAADMAHDLKGPARRMAELASLLQSDYKGRFDERADRYLTWIRENGQQMMDRIEEVLRLARIGIVRETVEPVDPAEVARDVLKGCAEHLERQGVRVQVADRFPRLACNRVHLFQVLDNVVRNAIKFSVEGRSLELEIGVRGMGQETAILVRDNGIGIPSADRERIFEPFERLGHQQAPGMGIGLAIVKKIIELYRGRVWVESEPGQGTTVLFTLPLFGELSAAEPIQEGARS
ncbi:MAG: HAMP domain-containing protein [Nitrospirae bacterium]|nr:MAG: HAMP domain-containing protein [Nitrospirota bacterium]